MATRRRTSATRKTAKTALLQVLPKKQQLRGQLLRKLQQLPLNVSNKVTPTEAIKVTEVTNTPKVELSK